MFFKHMKTSPPRPTSGRHLWHICEYDDHGIVSSNAIVNPMSLTEAFAYIKMYQTEMPGRTFSIKADTGDWQIELMYTAVLMQNDMEAE